MPAHQGPAVKTGEATVSGSAKGGGISELKRGWPALLGATIGLGIGGAALPFYTVGLFVGHFETELGWTRSQMSLVALASTAMLALAAPLAGLAIDRWGVRLVAAVGYAALAGTFWFNSQMTEAFWLYALVHIAGLPLIAGTTPIGLTRPVNAVFDRMRGMALGIAIGGTGVAAFLAPLMVGRAVEADGWRAASQQLALVVLFGAPLVLWLIGINAPRRPPQIVQTGPRAPLPFRDPLFLRLAACFLLVALAVAGFTMHFVPMLTDQGLSFGQAVQIQGVLGVAVLAGRIVVGAAMDRFFAPLVGAVLLIVTAAGFVLLAVGGVQFAVVAAFAIGFALGAEGDLIAYLTARYFGMRTYGRIYGLFYGAFMIGLGSSPYMLAKVHAASGSYVPAMWIAAGLLSVAALLFLTAPKFPAQEAETEGEASVGPVAGARAADLA